MQGVIFDLEGVHRLRVPSLIKCYFLPKNKASAQFPFEKCIV